MACVARGQPDILRCVRKVPLEWPLPSQPGVGHLHNRQCTIVNNDGSYSLRTHLCSFEEIVGFDVLILHIRVVK